MAQPLEHPLEQRVCVGSRIFENKTILRTETFKSDSSSQQSSQINNNYIASSQIENQTYDFCKLL